MNHAFSIIPLTIEARGEIITNNLPEFRELVREALGNINRDLKSDEDFGQAELDVKALKQAEDTVRAAAVQAFDEKLKELVDGLNETAEEIRAPRLELEKLIAKRKDDVKAEIVEEFLAEFDIEPATARKSFQTALKAQMSGKRTLESMRTACRVYQKTQQAIITDNRKAIESFETAHGQDMTMDRCELELKSSDFVTGELRRRFEAKKATEERKRLEAEAAKAKAEAQAAIREAEAAKQPAPVNVVPMKGMLPKSDLPPPPKIGSLPTGPSPAAEWEAFKSAVLTSFGPLKAAKAMLKHPQNVERASAFAQAVNAAWNAMKEMEVAQ
jgi:hypothetical protein